MYQKALFIFRRDLRLCDNTGLIEAARTSDTVTPCFIVDPRQASQHPYFSSKAFGFMILSLEDLAQQLSEVGAPLSIFEGQAEHVINRMNKRRDYDAIFLNKDYTPFSKKRDAAIAAACLKEGVAFHDCSDVLLHDPQEVATSTQAPYAMFSHFLKKARTIPVRQAEVTVPSNFSPHRATLAMSLEDSTLVQAHKQQMVEAGRVKALEILANMEQFEDYESERECPAQSRTTRLSAHNKFGTCSVREVYHAIADHFGPEHRLITELYWRDFYYYIASFFPHVFGHAFHRKYDALPWSGDVAAFHAWCDGRTGFPIIDAGMRELNETGFVHNRVRMLVASFLVKDLHIDWRWGERYFAQKLVDYDPAVNNGNWQWCASTGSDAQPYFRIFNPWVQQRKYDPDCQYIKTWLPELRAVPPERIHALSTPTTPVPLGYPRMMVDHVKESRRAKELYETVTRQTTGRYDGS
ncbi:MAG: DNA photolyase family protein [Euryarchaeota archaeon]|nr:DNA photolyase family protein [Euryarchaeota archaeon]